MDSMKSSLPFDTHLLYKWLEHKNFIICPLKMILWTDSKKKKKCLVFMKMNQCECFIDNDKLPYLISPMFF